MARSNFHQLWDAATNDEIDRLVSYQNPLTAIGCRNNAILITLLDTGLRISELCNLSFDDAHIEEGYLKVMGKGSKERIVPIGALSQKMLWRYIIHFRPKPLTGSEDFLFLSLDGNRLKANTVKLLFHRWGKRPVFPGYMLTSAAIPMPLISSSTTVEMCFDYSRFWAILHWKW